MKKLLETTLSLALIVGLTGCGEQNDVGSKTKASITLDASNGINTAKLENFYHKLKFIKNRGSGSLAVSRLLSLVPATRQERTMINQARPNPGQITCVGSKCRAVSTGNAVSVSLSRVSLPVFGEVDFSLDRTVVVKYQFKGNKIEFCSIQGVTVSGLSLYGAILTANRGRSTVEPIVPPSWSYPSDDCDF